MAPEDAPATKRDICELAASQSAMEERLMERMRDMQTELLRAFQPWQNQV